MKKRLARPTQMETIQKKTLMPITPLQAELSAVNARIEMIQALIPPGTSGRGRGTPGRDQPTGAFEKRGYPKRRGVIRRNQAWLQTPEAIQTPTDLFRSPAVLDFFQNEATSQSPVSPFEAFSQAPSPQTPEAFWQMEKALYQTASQAADQIILAHLINIHQDKEFVSQAIARARSVGSVSFVNKGLKPVSVLLSGGTRVVLKTPYLRVDLSAARQADAENGAAREAKEARREPGCILSWKR